MLIRPLSIRTLVLALASAAALSNSAWLRADEPAPAVDNSKVSFAGVVNTNAVYVRSGPGENYYATQKLEQGAAVTVVGLKFDWLKVIPPEGSYSYVAKAYVEKRGDGSIGRVTKPDLNVRAGSALNAMKTTVQTKLDESEDVTIVGEQDEYFKIKPPQGAYLYINKQFVDPVKPIATGSNNVAGAPAPAIPVDTKNSDPISSAPVEPIVTKTPDAPVNPVAPPVVVATNAGASTQPSVLTGGAAPTSQPSNTAVASASTQPATPSAEAQFDTVESAFLDATSLPLASQPLEALTTKYQALSKDTELPASMQRIADMRLSTLKLRTDAKAQYVDAQKMQADASARSLALRAEQDELKHRIDAQNVSVYSAVGTLQTSSLQEGGQTLYRLTDPATGHTLVYLRTSDPKYVAMLNQFIGVRGDITEDTALSLKMITPTSTDSVDVSKVNSTVTAQIMPMSLLSKGPTASITN